MNVRAVLAAAILIITAAIVGLILYDVISVGAFIGPFRFSHWMTWAGSLFVGVYAPLYHILKKRYPQRFSLLIDIHSFGFLIAFMLISIHFAGQMSRSTLPELGEGLALFVTMLLLVSTGVVQRFWRPERKPYVRYTPGMNRYVHTSLIFTFYIVVVIHAVANLI